MATAKEQVKLKTLFEQSMKSGGLQAFRTNWEQSIGLVDKPTHEGTVQEFDGSKRAVNHNDWAIGEVFDSLLGPRWKSTFEQCWQRAANARFEGVGGDIMAGDTPYVSAALDVVAGLMNARALEREKSPEWIWDKMVNVEEATGEGGFHIGSRVMPGTQSFNDLGDGQTLPTQKVISTRVHRNRTLNQGLRVKVNYWAMRDDLTSQIMESVDQVSVFVLAERERKCADAVMGIGTTAASGSNIGTIGQAMPMVQDGLSFNPYQKGTYGTNASATTAAPENGAFVANFGNANETDGLGLTNYNCIANALQVLNANRDPFTGLPPNFDFNGMTFLCAPAVAATQLKFLLQQQALWQIAWGNAAPSSISNATVSGYNLVEAMNLKIIESQYWMNRLVDVGAYKVAADGTASTQKLTNAAGDTYSTAGSIMSAFYMGHFKDAVSYWQRMPYTTVQVPLSSIEVGEQTVIVQDHRERGQCFWRQPRKVWRAWA